jgi:hypothetical protein
VYTCIVLFKQHICIVFMHECMYVYTYMSVLLDKKICLLLKKHIAHVAHQYLVFAHTEV